MRDWSELVWPKADFSAVPLAVITDQDVYEREQKRIWRGPVWLCLGHEAQIPNPGDFFTTYAGDVSVVANRAEDGTVHALVNRCAHRATLVVRQPKGHPMEHTCVYHRWCYDLKGNLIGVPFERGAGGKGGMPKDFKKSEHGMKALTTSTYAGVIWASFDPEVEPLEDYLGETMKYSLDRVFSKPVEVMGHMRQRLNSNWKSYWENLNDGFHAGLLHQMPAIFGLHANTQEGALVLDRYGRHATYWVKVEDEDPDKRGIDAAEATDHVFADLKVADPKFLDFHDEWGDRVSVSTMSIFPGVLIAQLSNFLMIRQIRPKSPREFELYWTILGYVGDDPELRMMRQRNVAWMGPGGCISMEDSESGSLIRRVARARSTSTSRWAARVKSATPIPWSQRFRCAPFGATTAISWGSLPKASRRSIARRGNPSKPSTAIERTGATKWRRVTWGGSTPMSYFTEIFSLKDRVALVNGQLIHIDGGQIRVQ